MKTKITLLAATALLAGMIAHSAPSMADTTPVPDQGGLYLGGFGGYGWTDSGVPGASDVDGTDWGLFAGYKMTGLMQSFGWNMTGAVEFQYDWSNADDAGAGNTVEKDHEWEVDFRPGLAFLSNDNFNFNPYGIIGYRRANFDNNIAGADDQFNGFVLGIGTEMVVDNHFGVRFDYDHVWYGSDGGVDPDENDLRLGVAYHFN